MCRDTLWNCCIEDMCLRLQLLDFEGRLAQKLRFRIFNFWNLKETLHDSFVFKSSTFGIGRKARTYALFSHLQLVEFEGCLPGKLCFLESWKRFECEDLQETVCFCWVREFPLRRTCLRGCGRGRVYLELQAQRSGTDGSR